MTKTPPKEGISNSDICSVASDVIMAITAQPSNSTSISYKKRNIVLKIHSDTANSRALSHQHTD